MAITISWLRTALPFITNFQNVDFSLNSLDFLTVISSLPYYDEGKKGKAVLSQDMVVAMKPRKLLGIILYS